MKKGCRRKECIAIDIQNKERMHAEWKNVLIYRMKKGCRRKERIVLLNEERMQNERMYRYTE